MIRIRGFFAKNQFACSEMHFGHPFQGFLAVSMQQLAPGFNDCAGSPHWQINAGGSRGFFHPVHEALSREDGCGGNSNIALGLGALIELDGDTLFLECVL